MKLTALIIVMSMLFSAFVLAQDLEPQQVKRTWLLKSYAQSALRNEDAYTAIAFYEEYLRRKPRKTKVLELLAGLYSKVNSYESAAEAYRKIYDFDTKKNTDILYDLGDMLMSKAHYDSASVCFDKYLEASDERGNIEKKNLARKKLEGCEMGKTHEINSVKKNVISLNEINNRHLQSSPLLYSGNVLVFASVNTDSLYYNDSYSRNFKPAFYAANVSEREKPGFTELPAAFTGLDKEPVVNAEFSPDKKRLYFTVRAKNYFGKVVSHIYVRHKRNGIWQKPKELQNDINIPTYSSSRAVVAPSYNSQLEIVYFVSDRPGGQGGYDIWYSVYDLLRDTHSSPVNAGPVLNTAADEMSPFYDLKENYLYFSSDGHPGFGGSDVFRSRGSFVDWTYPENIGPPVNSAQNDLYYAAYPEHEKAFFISNRDEGMDLLYPNCCYDIFEFFEIDSTLINYNGRLVENSKDDIAAPSQNAVVTLCMQNPKSGKYICYAKDTTDTQGSYSFLLKRKEKYRLMWKKSGYFSDEFYFSTNDVAGDSANLAFDATELKKIPDSAVRIDDIYFEYDEYALTPESKRILDTTLYRMLRLNAAIKIEVAAHTDRKGTKDYNLRLSERRAESVAAYLTEKGINRERLKPKGYGMSRPVAPSFTPEGEDFPEGRKLNRRVEFKIIENGPDGDAFVHSPGANE
jgi:outer membrane protein OmpA-like peptidoglycan-associated protein